MSINRKLLIALLIAFWIVLLNIPFNASSYYSEKPFIKPFRLDQSITHYTALYGANEDQLRKTIKGESTFRCDVYGDNGKAYGIAQFHKPTFERWSKELGEELDYYSCHDQIKLMSWAFSKGDKYKRHWTAWRNLSIN